MTLLLEHLQALFRVCLLRLHLVHIPSKKKSIIRIAAEILAFVVFVMLIIGYIVINLGWAWSFFAVYTLLLVITLAFAVRQGRNS